MIGEVGDDTGYTLLPPFDTHNQSGYLRLASIELIGETLSYGKDIKVGVYERNGILDKYEADVLANSRIIGFRTQQGRYIYVPEAFVADAATDDTVMWSDQVLSINLGLMPKYQPYEPTKEAVAIAIKKHLGVTSLDMVVSRISSETGLTPHQSEQSLLARKAASKSSSGDVGEALMLRLKLCKALERIRALEEFIIKCHGGGCCCEENPSLFNNDTMPQTAGDDQLVNEGWADESAGFFNVGTGVTSIGTGNDDLVQRVDNCETRHRR